MTAEKVAKMDSSMNRILVVSLGLSVLACGADDVSDGGMDEVASTTEDSETGTETETETSTDTGTTTETSTDTDSGTETDTTGSTDGPMPDMGTMPLDPNENIPPPDEEGCPAIYAQDLLPTFQLTIQPVVWQMLQDEWNNGEANEEMGLDPTPFHPVQEFRYGDIVIYDAEIRLRGNTKNWDPLPGDKMQFQINFQRNDPDGHFLGLNRILFDAATYNRHMLRDRLALSIMREVGIPAPCANNARLMVNGEYYGIFTNIEKLDEAYLERAWADPSGNLWKRASWELKTNVDTANNARLSALRDATTLATIEQYLDLERSLLVFAAEAAIPDSDGMWAGGLNYYFYDDPISGQFQLLPWDLDNTFERWDDPPDGVYPVNPDPVVYEKPNTWHRPWYDLALQDPSWFAYYIDSIDLILHQAYTPEKLLGRIDTWTEQIQDAVFEDVNKPYTNSKYLDEVDDLREYVEQRYWWVDEWLACWQEGGQPDAEGYCVEP
ncbi:MAG: CotH kinase family protein [Myxococcales bacterium]|nr:CotH kinase family protein [Myxococcales bacterium]